MPRAHPHYGVRAFTDPSTRKAAFALQTPRDEFDDRPGLPGDFIDARFFDEIIEAQGDDSMRRAKQGLSEQPTPGHGNTRRQNPDLALNMGKNRVERPGGAGGHAFWRPVFEQG